MAYFHTTVLDNQIKALPTVDTVSGSIATFDTDLTENLVSVKCQIVATQSGSGTPSPSNPRPITVYTSLNLSHSGSDTSNPNVTNIPFGQTVANGVLDIGSGVLTVTHGYVDLSTLNYTTTVSRLFATSGVSSVIKKPNSTTTVGNIKSSIYFPITSSAITGPLGGNPSPDGAMAVNPAGTLYFNNVSITTVSDFQTAMNGIILVYELETPLTIQLDSITLQALLNENNIWCDTGDTEVKYLLTVGKKIS